MTVNLLRKKSLEEAQALVECSFGNFLNQGQTDRREEECAALEMQVNNENVTHRGYSGIYWYIQGYLGSLQGFVSIIRVRAKRIQHP
jgi:hypothetical protein